MSPDLRSSDAAIPGPVPGGVAGPASGVSGAAGAARHPRAESRDRSQDRPIGPSVAQIIMGLAWVWCLAICAHLPSRITTTGMAAGFGLLFMLLLPFNRWACFLVLVAMAATEDVLRGMTSMRYNTLHYATFLLLPVAFVLTRPRAQFPKPLIFWLAMSLWFAVSVFWCQNFRHWIEWTTEYVGVMCLALLTRQLATSPRRRRELCLVFAVTALAAVVGLLVIFGVATGSRLGNMHGIDTDPNGIGRLAAMGMLMLAISAAESERGKIFTPVNITLWLALGLGIMMTQSRGTMLAVTGAALTIALGQPRVHHRLIALAACGLLGAALVFTAMSVDPTGMERRWKSTTGNKTLNSATAGRSELARTTGYVLKDNWIAGVGAGQYSDVYREYSVLARSRYGNHELHVAHSGFLQVPSEGGIVATLLMAGFYLSLWMAASRLPPGQRRAVARAILVYHMLGLFSAEGIEKENWIAIGMLLVWFWENSHLQRQLKSMPHAIQRR